MNTTRKFIVILFGATLGVGAFAQEATPDTWMGTTLSKSRDTVRHELRPVQRHGSVNAMSEAYNFVGDIVSTKSRDQVRAELLASKASGEYELLNAEVSSFTVPQPQRLAKAGE